MISGNKLNLQRFTVPGATQSALPPTSTSTPSPATSNPATLTAAASQSVTPTATEQLGILSIDPVSAQADTAVTMTARNDTTSMQVWDVRVTNPDASTYLLEDAFTLIPLP